MTEWELFQKDWKGEFELRTTWVEGVSEGGTGLVEDHHCPSRSIMWMCTGGLEAGYRGPWKRCTFLAGNPDLLRGSEQKEEYDATSLDPFCPCIRGCSEETLQAGDHFGAVSHSNTELVNIQHRAVTIDQISGIISTGRLEWLAGVDNR